MWFCYTSLSWAFLDYVFFLMTYYLLFMFILDYGNDVREKANSSDFLI